MSKPKTRSDLDGRNLDLDTLVSDPDVLKEFGDISAMALHRWTNDPNLGFPPIISFVTGTGPMVRSLSADFDQWAFVTGRHRRTPHGKTDMPNG